jgi:transcriptional regulator with XRE-family HTH domain
MSDGTSGLPYGGGEPESSDSLRAFGEVVKAFRKRAGLTQEQFAPRVRYAAGTVASIEQGRRLAPPDFVERAGLAGPMQLLETPENRWFAYNEAQRGGLFIAHPKEISVLQMRYARMRSQALTPEDSMGLLQRTRGAL